MILDLTHPLRNGITVYPGTLPPSFVPGNTLEADGFAELTITMTSHTGTHIDAPCHIIPGGKSLSDFPIDHFLGPGVLIDVRNRLAITLADLSPHERRIKQAQFLIFRTGWQQNWNTPDYFDDFPTLTPDAARWIADRRPKAVGFDAISADPVSSHGLPNHHTLLGNNILIIENLTHLESLPTTAFEMHCIPLNIANADGAPVCAYARY